MAQKYSIFYIYTNISDFFLQKILQKSYEASEHFQHGVGIFIQTYYLKNGFFPQDSALPTKCLTVLQ